jgi:hypothetical protein
MECDSVKNCTTECYSVACGVLYNGIAFRCTFCTICCKCTICFLFPLIQMKDAKRGPLSINPIFTHKKKNKFISRPFIHPATKNIFKNIKKKHFKTTYLIIKNIYLCFVHKRTQPKLNNVRQIHNALHAKPTVTRTVQNPKSVFPLPINLLVQRTFTSFFNCS